MLRRIKTQEDIDRRNKKNQIIVGVVLVVLLVVSTLGYSLMSGDSSAESKIVENGLEFKREGNLWKTVIDDQTFRLEYLPSELENVSVNGSFDLGQYYNKVLYFHNPIGASEILGNIGSYILRTQEACLNETICEGDLPIKTCEDNIIIFLEGNKTKVYNRQNCVFIEGDPIHGADAFLYKLLKV